MGFIHFWLDNDGKLAVILWTIMSRLQLYGPWCQRKVIKFNPGYSWDSLKFIELSIFQNILTKSMPQLVHDVYILILMTVSYGMSFVSSKSMICAIPLQLPWRSMICAIPLQLSWRSMICAIPLQSPWRSMICALPLQLSWQRMVCAIPLQLPW